MTKAMVRALGWYLPRGIMKILFAILGLVVIPLGLLIPQDRVYRKYLGGLPVDTYLRFLLSYYQNVMYNTETKVVTYTGKALPRFLDIYNNPKDALGDKYYLDSHCRDNE
jgi:predicted N-acyltransferase